jgi:hypothetical protein
MTGEELKKELDALSQKELVELGYTRVEVFNRVVEEFSSSFRALSSVLVSWSDTVVKEAEISKNVNILVFVKAHLGNLRQLLSKQIKTGVNENK